MGLLIELTVIAHLRICDSNGEPRRTKNIRFSFRHTNDPTTGHLSVYLLLMSCGPMSRQYICTMRHEFEPPRPLVEALDRDRR